MSVKFIILPGEVRLQMWFVGLIFGLKNKTILEILKDFFFFRKVNSILGNIHKPCVVFISENLCIFKCLYHSQSINMGRSDLSSPLPSGFDFKDSLSVPLSNWIWWMCFYPPEGAPLSPPGVSVQKHMTALTPYQLLADGSLVSFFVVVVCLFLVEYLFNTLSTLKRHPCPVLPTRHMTLGFLI